MKIKQACAIIAVCMLVALMTSCGYTTKVTLPSGVESIYVPNFKYAIPASQRYTYEPGMEIDITNAVIDRLLFDGNLRVLREEEADATLFGELTGFNQGAVRYTSTDGVGQYRLFITVRLRFVKNDTGEVLWEERRFTSDSEYFTEGRKSVSQRGATNEAMEKMAKSIVDRITEDW